MLDFGAAGRGVLRQRGTTSSGPTCTPAWGSPGGGRDVPAATGTLGPMDRHLRDRACIYALHARLPANERPQRHEKDRLALSLSPPAAMSNDKLIEVTEWWHVASPLSRPAKACFALQKGAGAPRNRALHETSFRRGAQNSSFEKTSTPVQKKGP